MSDHFHPISLSHLWRMITEEFNRVGTILGIDKSLFFNPDNEKRFRTGLFGHNLANPLGVAAGPQTQIAHNIVAAWLTGSRYIELKTVQTLDELEISKPCIDIRDEGYNCEWSQELKIRQSFDEYLNAWIIIHALHHLLGYKKPVDTIFNMSVGYDLRGIQNENVQWFLSHMKDAGKELKAKVKELELLYPDIKKVKIPACISDNITLSTMHGCPAGEIKDIALYLMKEQKLHTFVKLNPTLLGSEKLREILSRNLKFKTIVPDEAFDHDLKFEDAVSIIAELQDFADRAGLTFGLKLTNTLESLNREDIFNPENKMVYMSGRALHPIAINVAAKLQNRFEGKLKLSFSAGVDAFNVPDVLSCGFETVTVCSDLLKPGGYTRMAQYFVKLSEEFNKYDTSNIQDFILKKSEEKDFRQAALKNLNSYAKKVIRESGYQRNYVKTPTVKTQKKLEYFDCISAPCEDTCPAHQGIPSYMYHTAHGDFESAYHVIAETNAFPNATGMVCDHVCQTKCTRINYDESLAIRDIKRFVVEWHNNHFADEKITSPKTRNKKVAIIGAGPAGLSAAYFLLRQGFEVDIFEEKEKPGGMVSGAIPKFRIDDESVMADVEMISSMGANILYNYKVTETDFTQFQQDYCATVIAVGAQDVPGLEIPGIHAQGVYESLDFLNKAREGVSMYLGKNVVVFGGGNTAMDIARTSYRMVGADGKVTIVYRRTVEEMPAVYQEVLDAMEEGVDFLELAAPLEILTNDVGKVVGVKCIRMKPGMKDESGRHSPVPVPGSEFVVEADTVIPAIGQSIRVDFMDKALLKTQENLFETQVPNVYIGGDARLGASSLINAVGDGRKIAELIILKENGELYPGRVLPLRKADSVKDLMLKKAVRVKGEHPAELALDNRRNFSIVSTAFTSEQAVKEASRCLLCDEVCNICTTVCPNFANFSYETKKETLNLQKLLVEQGRYRIENDVPFKIHQGFQILNIDNFCNECGNCDTFCPTQDAPNKSKPKVFLTWSSFDEADRGYYLDNSKNRVRLLGKADGRVCVLEEKKETFIFENENVRVSLEKNGFAILEASLKPGSPKECTLSLREAANMHVILQGMKKLVFA
ncbi:MAG: putative selenate reductase subunit YgfK [Bacteroidales bacterium]|nr:putative selenate reductase subunit YgfK [Bacteroidales bacterium]